MVVSLFSKQNDCFSLSLFTLLIFHSLPLNIFWRHFFSTVRKKYIITNHNDRAICLSLDLFQLVIKHCSMERNVNQIDSHAHTASEKSRLLLRTGAVMCVHCIYINVIVTEA